MTDDFPHEIPVEFEYKGVWYKGRLCEVQYAGAQPGTKWHLMIGKRYYGTVLYWHTTGIRFVSNCWECDAINDAMEMYVISWYG